LQGDGNDQKGQGRNIGGRVIEAQARFIATLFEVAACGRWLATEPTRCKGNSFS
jgi:hypothetical protein